MQSLDKRRFQVTIAGRVTCAVTGRAVPDVLVTLAGPPAFQALVDALAVQHGAAWAAIEARVDRARTRADGFFHIGDVPDGAYTLTLTAPGGGAFYGARSATAIVTRDVEGRAQLTMLDLTMPPTAVTGRVMRAEGAPPNPPVPQPLARVRVRGAGQEALTNEDGEYYLTGVDPGEHVLRFTSPELNAALATVTVSAGVVTTHPTITLSS